MDFQSPSRDEDKNRARQNDGAWTASSLNSNVQTSRVGPKPVSLGFIKKMLFVIDPFALLICFNLAYFFRLNALHPEYLLTKEYLYLLAAVVPVAYVLDLYNPSSLIAGLRSSGRFVIASLIVTMMMAVVIYIIKAPVAAQFGRSVLPGTLALFAVWGGLSRLLAEKWYKSRRQKQKWLVIVEEPYLMGFHRDFKKSGLGGEVHYLIDKSNPVQEQTIQAPIGSWQDLDIALAAPWTEIVILSNKALTQEKLDRLLNTRLQGTRVFSAIDFYETHWMKVPIYFLDSTWVLLSRGFGLIHNPIGLRIKRVLDIMGALLLLPIALPLTLFGAFLVILENGWPVIYTQTRTGKDGRPFQIYKLRTMKRNAEAQGAQWAQEKDNRVLFVGRFLRKFRIDELPQLWNVLKGEMSFIGPRPERPEMIKDLEQHIPYYQLRHLVAPGITGWAQVLYNYGSSIEDAKEKLQYDLYYIKNYTVFMDIAIVFKTIRTLAFGAGR